MFNPIYIAGFSVLLAIISIAFSVFIYLKTHKLMRGKTGADLEDTFNTIIQDLKLGKQAEIDHLAKIADINKRLASGIRGVHILRFNPFPESGSNQSFAIGVVDENKNGFVLSSLYGRERMSVFAKPITSGKSEHELTPEEDEALKKAIENLK